MGRTPQETLRIENRRRQVTELRLKGSTQALIAIELNVSQGTVSSDIKATRKEWKKSGIRNLDDALEEALQRLYCVIREAFKGWQRSQEPAETTRVVQHNGQTKAEKTVRQQTGDPRFLEIARRANEMCCKLLGLEAQAGSTFEPADDKATRVKVTREFWKMWHSMISRPADALDDPFEAYIARDAARSLKSGSDATSRLEAAEEGWGTGG